MLIEHSYFVTAFNDCFCERTGMDNIAALVNIAEHCEYVFDYPLFIIDLSCNCWKSFSFHVNALKTKKASYSHSWHRAANIFMTRLLAGRYNLYY
jgi:hypothetical protein